MRILVLLLALWSPAFANELQPVRYDDDRGAKDLSPGARDLLGKGVWWTLATEHFTCWSPESGGLVRFADRAEFAYRRSAGLLGGATSGFQGRMVLLNDDSAWQRLPEIEGRADAVSFQNGREVFILMTTNEPANVLRIMHEMVHLRLRLVCPEGIPLWAEEGLAAYLGWKLAAEYGRTHHAVYRQDLPQVDPARLSDLEQLTRLREYPAEVGSARAFYRQSESLVRAVAFRIGDDRLPEWVASLCGEKAVWRDALAATFGFSEQDFYALEEEMKKNSIRPGWGD